MEKCIFGQFNESFPPVMDGVALTVWNYAQWLNRSVAPTMVITPSFPGYQDNAEFSVLRYSSLPMPFRRPYRMGLPRLDLAMHKQLGKQAFQLVHAHSPFSAGQLALRVAKQNKIPLVATFHSKFRDDFERVIPFKPLVNMIVKHIIRFYEAADEVWIPQAAVEETLRSYGYKGKCEVVENGVDFEPMRNLDDYRNQSRRLLNISPDENVFLFVGQHVWEKNVKLIIESLAKLKQTVDFTMLFVGQGYAAQAMQQLSEQLGLSGNIRFMGPIFDRDQIRHIYAAADLFLFPSLYDNAPLVVREAASVGTPSVLIKGSTAAEVVSNGYNGFLTENNTELFANKIAELVTDHAFIASVGMGAMQTLCRSWQNVVEEVADRYHMLIARKEGVIPMSIR